MYYNFANLFSKLSESKFYKKVSFSKIYRVKSTCIRLAVLRGLRTPGPVSANFIFAPKIDNAAITMLHCLLGLCLVNFTHYHAWTSMTAHDSRKFNFKRRTSEVIRYGHVTKLFF